MGMMQEFKEFALRGNVIDLAVGVVIGASFGKIVTSLVSDLITPVISYVIGSSSFKSLSIIMRPAEFAADGKELTPALLLSYGSFIQSIIDFTIVALVIFLVVKVINRLRRQEEVPDAAPVISDEVKLLTEIRDALNKSGN